MLRLGHARTYCQRGGFEQVHKHKLQASRPQKVCSELRIVANAPSLISFNRNSGISDAIFSGAVLTDEIEGVDTHGLEVDDYMGSLERFLCAQTRRSEI